VIDHREAPAGVGSSPRASAATSPRATPRLKPELVALGLPLGAAVLQIIDAAHVHAHLELERRIAQRRATARAARGRTSKVNSPAWLGTAIKPSGSARHGVAQAREGRRCNRRGCCRIRAHRMIALLRLILFCN
jgi:hypothetical protein